MVSHAMTLKKLGAAGRSKALGTLESAPPPSSKAYSMFDLFQPINIRNIIVIFQEETNLHCTIILAIQCPDCDATLRADTRQVTGPAFS